MLYILLLSIYQFRHEKRLKSENQVRANILEKGLDLFHGIVNAYKSNVPKWANLRFVLKQMKYLLYY